MILRLFLASLAIACATNTISAGSIFSFLRDGLRENAIRREMDKEKRNKKTSKLIKLLAELFNCRYCLSHWIGFILLPLFVLDWKEYVILYFPSIWIANHSITFYTITGQVIPYWQARLQTGMINQIKEKEENKVEH